MSLWDAEAMPSRVLGLVHTALILQSEVDAPALTRNRLKNVVSPFPIRSDALFDGTFLECLRLGLFTSDAGGSLLRVADTISEGIPANRRAVASEDFVIGSLTAALRTHVLDRLASEPSFDPNFCTLLAWTLLQEGRNMPLTRTSAERLTNEQDPGRNLWMFNSTRLDSFVYWAKFLGFVTQHSVGNTSAFQPDPTNALERALSDLASQGESSKRLPIAEFLRRVERRFPWMENGFTARNIQDRLAAPPRREPDRVNDATAFALRRLEARQRLRLSRDSDADAMVLGWGGKRGDVSHVEIIGGTST